MNVEIGAEAALFLEKEYINGIFVAVHCEKRLAIFPSSAGKSLTKLSLAGNNSWLGRVW
jgi:hypothetical protein